MNNIFWDLKKIKYIHFENIQQCHVSNRNQHIADVFSVVGCVLINAAVNSTGVNFLECTRLEGRDL